MHTKMTTPAVVRTFSVVGIQRKEEIYPMLGGCYQGSKDIKLAKIEIRSFITSREFSTREGRKSDRIIPPEIDPSTSI